MTSKSSKKVTKQEQTRVLKNKQMLDMLTVYSEEAQLGQNYPLVDSINNNGFYPLILETMEDSFSIYTQALGKRRRARKPAKISAPPTGMLGMIFQWRELHEIKSVPQKPLKVYKLPLWRDASDELKTLWLQRVLDSEARGIPFNLNLSHELVERAKANKKGMVDYLHRHLSRHFKKGFGQTVDFWFVLELSKKPDEKTQKHWHIHGTLDLIGSKSAKKDAIRVLKKASCVKDKGFLQYAVRLSDYSKHQIRGSGWHNYLSKDFTRTRKILDKPSSYSTTTNLQRRAKKLFQEERKEINSFLSSKR